MHMHTTLPNLHHLLMLFLLQPRWAMYMCINAYAYVYTYMHTCIPTHPQTCIHDTHTHYKHTCMHAYNTCTNTYLDTFIHTRVCLCVCVCACAYALVRTCVSVHQVRTVTITISAQARRQHSRPSWHDTVAEHGTCWQWR